MDHSNNVIANDSVLVWLTIRYYEYLKSIILKRFSNTLNCNVV